MPAVLVTGASTGIGAATAHHLAGLGHRVFAGVRSVGDGERLVADAPAGAAGTITPVIVDVTDKATIDAAVERIAGELGSMRFAGVVNNAGVARGGPLEYLPLDEWRDQLEVNVIGQVAVTQAFLPLIRRGGGRVVFVGSIGGRVGTPLMGPYCASKFAIEGIAESLRHELHPAGIKVAVIEPGAVRTAIWDKGRATIGRLLDDADPEMLERYGPVIDQVVAGVEKNDKGGVDPLLVAKAIDHALFAEQPKLRYVVGPDAKGAALLARFAPDATKDAMVRRLG